MISAAGQDEERSCAENTEGGGTEWEAERDASTLGRCLLFQFL